MSDDKSLFKPTEGVNSDVLRPGLIVAPAALERLAARAALVSALNKYALPKLIKMSQAPSGDREHDLRVIATMLKYGLGEAVEVKIGNEALLSIFISITVEQLTPNEEQLENWMNALYQGFRDAG